MSSDKNYLRLSQATVNYFTPKESIMKSIKRLYPIAAVDVETAKYYQSEDMTKMKLE